MSNSDRDAARLYHEVTKHSYTNVRSSPHALDWENRPLPYKIYPAAGAIALPRELNLSAMPATAAIAGVPASAGAAGAPAGAVGASADAHEAPLNLEGLTRILFCADGLTQSKTVGGEAHHFRAAASAGALYPIEIYLAASEVEGLEPGLYYFSPADLKLRGLRRGDWRAYLAQAAMRPALANARAILVLSAIFWRSAWKYRARAYRYCFWDAGTILANLLAAANAEGLAAEIVTVFEDAPAERLIDADGDREGIICLVALGQTEGAIASRISSAGPADVALAPLELERLSRQETEARESIPASHGTAAVQAGVALAPLELETIPLSSHERMYEDLVKIHRASRLESIDEVRALAAASLQSAPSRADTAAIVPAVLPASEVLLERSPLPDRDVVLAPSPLPANDALGLGETILRRGSTRVFDHEPITAEELATIMATSRAPLHADFPSMVEPYLIVNAVTGVEPGAYYYDRKTGSFELLKAGDFRGEAGYLCLEQPLGADCSALICYMTNLDRALEALGNRGYRDAHLEAGILGGRVYLAAYSLGCGATGLTFYDDDTTKFFTPHAADKSPLLMMAVGVPRSRATALEDESDG